MRAAIRSGEPENDAAACAAIYAPFVTESWISHGWLVAEVRGKVAGYAYGSPHRERAAYASSCDVAVYVDPAHSRQGIGRALYGALLPALAERGFHAAYAGIALPNEASVGLHEAMGFTPVGIYREVGWKLGHWRDVGWWQRLL